MKTESTFTSKNRRPGSLADKWRALTRGTRTSLVHRISQATLAFVDRYSILLAGVVIYVYFLITSSDKLRYSEADTSFLDYLLQFDSVIMMWMIAVVVIQLQKYRRQTREQEDYRRTVQLEFDRQQTQLSVLNEITEQLQDRINNPLAIIAVTTHSMRRKFDSDPDVAIWLDRIDNALQRVHVTIKDIKAYQTQKIVEDTPLMKDTRAKKDQDPSAEPGVVSS